MNKLPTFISILSAIAKTKNSGKKIGYISGCFEFNTTEADEFQEEMLKLLKPDYLFTSIRYDKYWKKKKILAKKLGIAFKGRSAVNKISSSGILEKLKI